ncbi:class B sortase [Acetatifactor muris]|uniref:Sortase family protein n=1 Tax=Acetatifactor muris TaxID=879566 RepID=A0A2K4ZMI0_9FIRM|nr:class B sortase [Acetatifactor muris]MCI8798651.1 class B sortase [Lachnospiraceae bacterium]MCR2049837.1 class B sortase [Acetatifactor muris]SOY31602.1 Sortase family protein [Acetatifactor muris]
MKKSKKQLIVKIVLGMAGLVAVFFLGRGISHLLYGGSGEPEDLQASADENLPPPKAALTEEELEALFRSAKESATASGVGEDGVDEEPDADQEPDEDTQTESEEAPPEEGAIDFEYLKTLNEDIYAWITVPGTIIDYPILQHPTDDSYYLHHNLDGSYGYPGCIYTESLNTKDFEDPNTVIYGHNMKAGTMFAELHKFEDGEFFSANDEVVIYLPEKTLHYQIFAAYVYDDRHLLYSFDFSDEDVYASYLKSIYDIRDMSANINREITVTEENKIITLVTCMPGEANAEKRLLVQAVLQEE